MSIPSFYAESFAPWCERARWALDHHGVAYREVAQVPLIAEVHLRLALRKLAGRVTVPLLVDEGAALMGSDRIARYAEERGTGTALFPREHEGDVAAWMGTSESIMIAGRAMLLPRMLDAPDALEEQLPEPVPNALRPSLRWVARSGVHHLMRKYGIGSDDRAHHDEVSRRSLDRMRAALGGKTPHLVAAGFSYADITMAAALQFVRPVDDGYIRLGPSTRRVWTHERLARDYADLLDWRDALYADRRRGAPP